MLTDFSQVSFAPLDIEEKRSMAYIVGLTDKAINFSNSINFNSNRKEKQIDYAGILEYMSFSACQEVQEKYVEPYLNFDDYDD